MPGRKAPGTRSHSKGGGSKGNRWQKGHSCVSNPGTRKFREQASSSFLHPVSNNPLFTFKNVNAIQSEKEAEMDEDLSSEVGTLTISDGSYGTGLNSVSTLRSLSSAWSKCSTNAFDKFLKRFRSDSLLHKEMLSILAASVDVIDGAGGKLKETEFFATFITLLDSCQPDQYQPVMSLVCILIGRVSPSVLKSRFEDIYPKIGTMLTYAMENNNDLLMRTCVEAFMKLLRVQDSLNVEDHKQLQEIFYMVLKCALHEKPRIRKKARIAIKRLVSQNKSANNAVTKLVLGWVIEQLSSFPTCGTKVVADTLTLLVLIWSSVANISKPGTKKLFEKVLRVMSSSDTSIMKIGFSFFVQVFENFTTIAECDPQDELFSKLIVAIWELQPDTRNTDCFILWQKCVLVGLVRLCQGPSQFDMMYLSSLLECSSPLWITNHGKAVAQIFKEYFPHLVSEKISKSVLEKCFRNLSKCLLTVPPNIIALQILEILLDCLSPDHYCTSAQDIFLQLIPLRNAQEVLSAMGKFIRAFGVHQIWASVDVATRWLVVLPLLSENLDNSEIAFWKSDIFPGLGIRTKLDVGWAALGGFCRNPKDPENFPAELIGKTLVEKPDVRIQVLAALRQFVDWPQCAEICKKYSKNYLPILFNLYVKTKPDMEQQRGHADAVGATIQKYLQHCDDSFILDLTSRALDKLTEEVNEAASPVFDLIAFLSRHVADVQLQNKILDSTLNKWKATGDSKRVYRIMTSLSKNTSLNQDVFTKLLDTLKQTPAETKSNAAALKLECISVITTRNHTWLKDFLPEVIINLLSVNAKAKKLASGYVSVLCNYLKESNQGISGIMDIIQVGLSSPIPLMVSCTLQFTYLAYKELKPDTPNQIVLQHCIGHLNTHTDIVIWRQCLQLLSLNLHLYKGDLGPLATQLGAIVSDLKYPRKDSTKLLARLIKVFGAIGVKAIVVNAEEPKMRNRIKNICKKLREKKVKEEKAANDDDDEEGEESDDEMDVDIRTSNRAPLLMKEGVVDFLNPSDLAKSFINERPAKQEDDFKMSADGKLIIDLEDTKSKRKRSAPDDSDTDEDDDDNEQASDDEVKQEMSKKTKSTSSMKSSKSKFSVRSFKSTASSKKSQGKSSGKQGKPFKGHKKDDSVVQRKKNKRFKSSSSVKSFGKHSRKSSAASTFRLRQ